MGGAHLFTNLPPDTDNRGLIAKLTSEMSQSVAMLNPVSLTVSSIICYHVDSALGSAHEHKTLALWAWQAYPGIVHVSERTRSEFGKSQLQLLSLSVLVQTLNLFYQCSGVFDLMGVE